MCTFHNELQHPLKIEAWCKRDHLKTSVLQLHTCCPSSVALNRYGNPSVPVHSTNRDPRDIWIYFIIRQIFVSTFFQNPVYLYKWCTKIQKETLKECNQLLYWKVAATLATPSTLKGWRFVQVGSRQVEKVFNSSALIPTGSFARVQSSPLLESCWNSILKYRLEFLKRTTFTSGAAENGILSLYFSKLSVTI